MHANLELLSSRLQRAEHNVLTTRMNGGGATVEMGKDWRRKFVG